MPDHSGAHERPVTAADGHSYERTAIEQWLASSDLSPLTGQRLPHKQLTRSHALRNAIEEEHAAVAAAQAAGGFENVPAAPTGVKVILLGDSAVGKSSLVHRVKEGSFSASASQPTIGCSFCTHTVTSPNQSFAPVNLAIWDTAGQEKYRAFTRQYSVARRRRCCCTTLPRLRLSLEQRRGWPSCKPSCRRRLSSSSWAPSSIVRRRGGAHRLGSAVGRECTR